MIKRQKRDLFVAPIKINCCKWVDLVCSRIMQQEELMEWHPSRVTGTRILVTEKWGKIQEKLHVFLRAFDYFK